MSRAPGCAWIVVGEADAQQGVEIDWTAWDVAMGRPSDSPIGVRAAAHGHDLVLTRLSRQTTRD